MINYAKLEKKIIDKWTKKDNDGNPVPVYGENGEVVDGAVNIIDTSKFQVEMSELMELENEIDYEKINFEDLKLETAKVRDLLTLEFLFD